MAAELDERIKQLMKKKRYTTIVREGENMEDLSGYIVGNSRRLVLLHQISNTLLDGYAVLRRRDVTKALHGRAEQFLHHVYISEGAAEEAVKPKKISLTNFEVLFTWLKEAGMFAAVFGEEDEIDGYVLGKIIRVKSMHVTMRHVDETGHYEDAVVDVPYDEITKVEFGDKHSEMMKTYARV